MNDNMNTGPCGRTIDTATDAPTADADLRDAEVWLEQLLRHLELNRNGLASYVRANTRGIRPRLLRALGLTP